MLTVIMFLRLDHDDEGDDSNEALLYYACLLDCKNHPVPVEAALDVYLLERK